MGIGTLIRRARGRPKLAGLMGVTLLLGGVAAGSLYFWYEQTFFIATDNATVSGALARISSPNGGRLLRLNKEVGDLVTKEDVLGVVDIPSATVLPFGGSRSTFYDNKDRLFDLPSPVSGVVVSRSVNTGDTVTESQTLFTVVDSRNLWVVANVEETKVARIHPGQPAEVHVDSLHRTLRGTVEAIIPATTATFSLLPQQNAAGNFTKVVQLVPVRIALQEVGEGLIVGASASVRIHLQ